MGSVGPTTLVVLGLFMVGCEGAEPCAGGSADSDDDGLTDACDLDVLAVAVVDTHGSIRSDQAPFNFFCGYDVNEEIGPDITIGEGVLYEAQGEGAFETYENDESDFVAFAALLTNGVDDPFGCTTSYATGSGSTVSTELFLGVPDLAGGRIDHLSTRVVATEMDSMTSFLWITEVWGYLE